MKPAPIVLFTYNRLWHTTQSVQALKKNELAGKSDLFIYSDGPKNPQDRTDIDKVHKYIRSIKDFNSVNIIENAENRGLESMYAIRVNHIMINPSSTRFMFLFRYRVDKQEITRLYTCDPDGENVFLFNTGSLVSHASWFDDKSFVVWASVPPEGQKYYIFKDFRAKPVGTVGESFLNEDGHPTFSPDGRYMLTDTYNNRARQRSLLIYDCKLRETRLMGKFYSPFRYSRSLRCDLHPRWSPDAKQICFDSVFEGQRQVYRVKL